MPATRGQFAQLLAAGLFAVIYDELKDRPELYSQFANVYPSQNAYEEDQLIAGLGSVPKKPEGEAIKMDEPIQGGSIRFTHEGFGLGFQVTREMWDDDKFGIMKRVSQDFAAGIRDTVETTYANVLNNGFGGGTKTIDGEDLFKTTHPLLGGGTYSNRLATDAALSTTGIQEALLLFEKMVNERGLKKLLMPEELWIPVDLQFKAAEILNSTYKPYSGTNEVNVFQGRLSPRANIYFTSATRWFVAARKSDHTFKGYWRVQPEFDKADDFHTKGASFSVYFRLSAGVTYWHGLVGSQGV